MHHQVTGKLCPAMWTHSEAELEGWRKFQKMFTARAAESNQMFYVQVGAFRSRENAEDYLAEVKKKYPGAFIKVM